MSHAVSSFVLFFSSLTILSIVRAQDRAPHGLSNENPIAFSPSAYDFFHPDTHTKDPCSLNNCSPLTVAAQVVEATRAHESRFPTSQTQHGRSRMGAGGIAGIVFGFVFAVLLTMGVYYVRITRRANVKMANSVRPDA
ncbi:hypothetical protein CJ030_MR2G024022 [Morella rubra]|uniref:Uncharacterized protein n=1 Tax=Morella rubra TaxID=262757 RepID=A0A6A1W8T6_9ROSI|nr:hypothetical protein CJ030_MR2G024022 [Morella rubra]